MNLSFTQKTAKNRNDYLFWKSVDGCEIEIFEDYIFINGIEFLNSSDDYKGIYVNAGVSLLDPEFVSVGKIIDAGIEEMEEILIQDRIDEERERRHNNGLRDQSRFI
jgi:hypothetical protein